MMKQGAGPFPTGFGEMKGGAFAHRLHISMFLFVWTGKGKINLLLPSGRGTPPPSLRGTKCRSNLGVY